MADKKDVFEEQDETQQAATPASQSEIAEAAREYAQSRIDRLAIEAQAKAIKKVEDEAAARFLTLCADNGVDGIRVTVEETIKVGDKSKKVPVRYTLGPKRDRYLNVLAEDGQQGVIAALKRSSKYAYLVTDSFSTSSLVSLLREFEDGNRELPPTLAEVVSLGEKFSVSMVKSAKG